MNGYAIEFLNIIFNTPYPLHHMTLVTCPYHPVDFLDSIVLIIYFANLDQSALLTKMSKLGMHVLYNLLLFT